MYNTKLHYFKNRMQHNNTRKLSIGLPVYNGEKFLKEKINALLNLNYDDYEIIISDNGSTDSTQKICENATKQENRIRYFRHDKNHGVNWNFDFTLQKADGEYFMWTSVDDIVLPSFIEKNIIILKSNPNIVCSTSQVSPYGEKTDYIVKKDTPNSYEKLKKAIIRRSTPLRNYPTNGTYDKKIRKYLKLRGHQQVFYGIYRTEQLREIFVHDFITGMDWATMLNALKYGDFYILEEVLAYRYDGGVSSSGLFSYARSFNLTVFEMLFLYQPLINWCWKSLGPRIFCKNLDCFIRLFFEGYLFLIVDIIRWSKKTMLRK